MIIHRRAFLTGALSTAALSGIAGPAVLRHKPPILWADGVGDDTEALRAIGLGREVQFQPDAEHMRACMVDGPYARLAGVELKVTGPVHFPLDSGSRHILLTSCSVTAPGNLLDFKVDKDAGRVQVGPFVLDGVPTGSSDLTVSSTLLAPPDWVSVRETHQISYIHIRGFGNDA
jgi:hypothetical protein